VSIKLTSIIYLNHRKRISYLRSHRN